MSKYRFKIELLSDLCVSDGGVYNSSVDIDVCYDSWGFPYIPAKRIRGCLRECGIELSDWGMDIPWKSMFGHAGSAEYQAAVRIGDACLQNYEQMKALAMEHKGSSLFHAQNILRHFSYLRVQTSLNYETGVADDTSLRVMRVVNKGCIFYAEVQIRGGEREETFKNALEKCCAILTEMGIARTRGLGQIRVTLETMEKPGPNPNNDSENEDSKILPPSHVPHKEGATILDYELYLEEPVICKSVSGGESRSLDYIEGSKLLGLVIGEDKKQDKKQNEGQIEDFLSMMDKAELFCSNAYISENGIRYTEIPSVIYAVKNDSAHYVNKLYPDPDCVREKHLQLNMMKHCYGYMDENDKLHKKSVKIEERYHHRRPEDKGIGRAREEQSGDSQFYQMSSIEAGQTMQGYFCGSADQIKKIYNILSQKAIYYIGYSRSSEYGKIRLRITGFRNKEDSRTESVKNFYVKLEAPAIIYNDRAFYSTDTEDLIREIIEVLGITEQAEKGAEVQRFVRYTTVGGYNTQWDRPKPIVTAFDKGTVLKFSLKKETKITFSSPLFLGERVTEGFGEATVHIIHDNGRKPKGLSDIYMDKRQTDSDSCVNFEEAQFVKDLCKDMFNTFVRYKAVESAQSNSIKINLEIRPIVSNMLQMCRENDKFTSIQGNCTKRYGKSAETKQKKLNYANKILETVEVATKSIVDSFCAKYHVINFNPDEDEVQKMYLESYLTQLKYILRQPEQENKEGNH